MPDWSSPAGRKKLRKILKQPIGPDGPTVFGGGDMRDLLEALEAAEARLHRYSGEPDPTEKKVRITSKVLPRVKHVGAVLPRVEPDDLARALGAERVPPEVVRPDDKPQKIEEEAAR